jgi:hypothetical protein
MSLYEELIKKARKDLLKLTLQQQREIVNIYEGAVDELSDRAKSAKDKSLSQRWALDYMEAVKEARDVLKRNLQRSITQNVKAAGQYATNVDLQLFVQAQALAGIDLGPHFTDMFSTVPDGVLESIIKGDLYRDGKGLSERIWRTSSRFGNDIDYIIKRGIAEKKSAVELAKDLEWYVKPESQRPWSWGKVYPNLRTRQVDYNAQRLARTSITHGYRESQYRSAQRNPFVEAIHWELSGQHYIRQVKHWGPDECDDYATQDDYGLGTGNFPKDKVPLSHPQCLCVTWPVIPKSTEQVADELRDWMRGGFNPKLDEWYWKHGEYFAFKRAS